MPDAIRSALAWMLYAVGHSISQLTRRFDWASWLYPAYSRIMLASSAIQGQRRGPWKDAEDMDEITPEQIEALNSVVSDDEFAEHKTISGPAW